MARRSKNKRATLSYKRVFDEVKYVDTTISQAADTTGAVTLIDGIARGDDVSERVGRKVVMRRITHTLVSYVTPSTGVDQTHRYLLVFDKQANGVAPAITDVLVSVSTVALPNLNNRLRFVILHDELKALNASAEPGSYWATGMRKLQCSLNVQFNSGDAGTVTDIQTGALYLITLGSMVAGVTAGTFSGRTRVEYIDH
jgi:hypothetical protein